MTTAIDRKIENLNINYVELNRKLDTLSVRNVAPTTNAQTNPQPEPERYYPLRERERGPYLSPKKEDDNPLKVFTFSDQSYRNEQEQQYRSDGFLAQTHQQRVDSDQLIDNIRRTLDESKKYLDNGFKTIKSDALLRS